MFKYVQPNVNGRESLIDMSLASLTLYAKEKVYVLI
jgi:hypothetical protein